MSTDKRFGRGPAAALSLTGLAFAACAVSVVSGLLGSLYYGESYQAMRARGLPFETLHAVHTTSAAAWIFLGATTAVHSYLSRFYAPLSTCFTYRLHLQLWLWAVAGFAIMATLFAGVYSGREYLEFHPAFSILILAGWLIFLWNYGSVTRFALRGRPVYVYMWNIALPLFAWTFLEAHLYLLPSVGLYPLRDIALQWKSYGVLVGSFNLMVYGTLLYLAQEIGGEKDYARSNTAFALFFVGLLNSFTNFPHHTYHLPQAHNLKWIGFVVSMAEIAILLKVLVDILRLPAWWRRTHSFGGARELLAATTFWTLLQLALAILLSIPPVNTLLHGTHAVTAHAMGSMLGIDSMILWAFFAYEFRERRPKDGLGWREKTVTAVVLCLNLCLLIQWGALLANGLGKGLEIYKGLEVPWYGSFRGCFPAIFIAAGAGMSGSILTLLALWALAKLLPAPSA